ncbi:MAG: SUMF1/EgtB/PvdO family nonheme iron enzyme [Planctomycetes bacterium]|nr:SUMF1/EgtB/PvdO family nonheme iron enzyme [Planctomycetota bacterium]
MGSSHDPRHLPEDLEAAVLEILDGDEHARAPALASLLRANAAHAGAIRSWLRQAGVTVPEDETGTRQAGPVAGEFPRPLGDYQLLAVIGRGGFGTVYRAEQQRPIRRPVAIKVLNPGMDSREILARFTGEREALNRMDHPGIARLLDAGSTPEGRPFFVMELVEGPTLTQYCRQRDLSLRARLTLFLDVLDAVQHAHQKAVVHRDLSANNVLVATVDERPRPKIIDFGIAKSLSDPLLLGGAETLRGTLLGTPEYMSPEQAAGRVAEVDTRTDIYSLGVQLYELLTGLLPIPGVVLRAQGIAGMARVIAEYRPPLASDLAPAPQAKAIRGDLDAILGKALAKDALERYSTVAEFANDLRRHLRHEPVLVASPSRLHRFVKFVRRNRAASIATAIAGTALATATVVLALALDAANRANTSNRQLTEALKSRVDDGFRLLANEERLRAATLAAAALPPPWPDNRDAYERWRADHGDPLREELAKMRVKLTDMRQRQSAQGGFPDATDQHLFTALTRLTAELEQFFTAGPAARVADLRQLQQDLAGQRDQERWLQIAAAVKTSDGAAASRAYGGMSLSPQAGLVPLGIDPVTRLAEFLDLASHPRGAGVPDANSLPDDHGMILVLLPPGAVRLGASRDEPGLPQYDPAAADDELGGESLWLDAFLIAKTELTVGQWARLSGTALEAARATLPATGMSWAEATEVLGSYGLDLPTEAQWEYACRAGSTTPWSWGEHAGRAAGHAHQGEQPAPVGSLAANAFGLFDMHGNVAEWCRDAKVGYGVGKLRAHDGRRELGAPQVDGEVAVRGGTFAQELLAMRSSSRAGRAPQTRSADLGLRPVRRLQ